MSTRRRLAVLGLFLALVLGAAGQNPATAGESPQRRTWGCLHLDWVDVEVCLDDPLEPLHRSG